MQPQRSFWFWLVFLAALTPARPWAQAAEATWKVGLARAKITPEKPLWMAGYGGRTRPAEGTLHDLWAKVLTLETPDGRRAVLVTADLLGFPKGVADALCAELASRHGLERSQIMLSGSHTHTGPVLRDALYDIYPLDDAQRADIVQYSERLEKTIAATVAEALGRQTPAVLWAGEGTTNFAVNRRNNKEKDVPELSDTRGPLQGPVDHRVPVLAIRAPDGRLLAVSFNYACHCTTLSSQEWSGDYAGFAQLALEEKHPGATALFHAGCGADQNPLPRRSVDRCKRYGEMLAAAVDNVLGGPMRPVAPQLGAAMELLTLPFGEQPDAEHLQKAAAEAGYRGRWAKRLLAEREKGRAFAADYPYPVQVWRLGADQLWIALGGEVVVDYGPLLRAKHGDSTWTTAYANDAMAYIPSRRVWEEGGYESGAFTVYGLPAIRWCPDVETRIVQAIERLVSQVKPIVATTTIAPAQQPPPAPGNEVDLIAVLKSADATVFDKAKACQRLAVIGTKECVPALAGMLSDKELANYARCALEPIPDSSVDEVLRAALGKLEGPLLLGAIDSVGARRDAKAVDDLKRLLGGSDARAASAAADAMGRIATPEAVKVLTEALAGPEPLRPAAAGACLTAAGILTREGKRTEAAAVCDAVEKADLPKHLRIAAAHDAIRARGADGLPLVAARLRADDMASFRVALQVANEIGGPDVAKLLMAELKLPAQGTPASQHPREALMIYTLGNLGEKAALPVILQAARSDAPDIRRAAIDVLGELGDVSAVPTLLAAAAEEGDVAQVARRSLVELEGQGVDEAIAKELDGAKGNARLVLIELVGQRGIASAAAALKKAADDGDPQVATAAIAAMGTTVALDDLSALVDRLVKPDVPEKAAVTKEALKKAVLRMPDRDAAAAKLLAPMAGASIESKGALLELLGAVGGKKALEGVAAAARDSNEAIQDAATRVLGEWMSPDVAPVLLELAKTGPEKYKVRTLRGYIRVARQLDVPTEERIAMCGKAIAATDRDAEKQLAIELLARFPSAESLALVAPHLDNPKLKEPASAAAVAIAEKILDSAPGPVAEAMKKASEAKNAEVANRAKALLKRAEGKLQGK
jgi:HEAT repeat protein